MAEKEVNEKTNSNLQAAIERMNAEAGYDVALAYASINAMTINEHARAGIPVFESQADITAVVDVVLRVNGGQLNANGLSALLNFAVAYGWVWSEDGKSMLRSEDVRKDLLAFVDGDAKTLIDEKIQKKEAMKRGFESVEKAVEKTRKSLTAKKAMSGSSKR